MIEWLKNWTNGIIAAVIIAVIFEMIIPSGNNKKYIKMVINLYVLFVILNPLISKFTNLKGINISSDNYEKYFSKDNVITASVSLDSDKLINSTAKKTIKDNITNKLKEKGYKVTSISIDINNKDGQINKINLSAEKDEINKNNSSQNNKVISINEVEYINISSNKKTKKVNLRKSEIQKLKKVISKEYEILEENIEIN